MAFFDEPRPRRMPGAAGVVQVGRWLRGAPSVIVVWLIVVTATTLLAVAVSVASLEAIERVADVVAGTEVTLFLPVDAPRTDAEALLARAKALPELASARLVTKEEALASLGSERFAALQVRSNPLPDAIVARVRWARSAGSAPSAVLAAARTALVGLSPAATADYDSGWARALDAWQTGVGNVDRLVQPSAAGVATLLALGLAFLAGRGCRGVPKPFDAVPAGTAWTALVTGAAGGAVAAVLAWYAFCAIVTISRTALVTMQPGGPIAGLIPSSAQWPAAAAIVVGSAVGFWVGTRGADSLAQ